MARKRTANELRIENRILRKSQTSLILSSIISSLIKYSALCIIAYFIYLSIKCIAGVKTEANIFVNILSDLKVNSALAYIFGGSSIIYGLVERDLRKRVIKRQKGRIGKLERELDSKRTSSGLSKDGATHPKDNIG